MNSQLVVGILAGVFTSILAGLILWYIKKTITNFSELKEWRYNQIDNLSMIVESDEQLEFIRSKGYIPTMGQMENPEDCPNYIFIEERRFSLLDKFIEEFLKAKKSISKKRYIILGGSGMGKSTFVAALYCRYIDKFRLLKTPLPIYIKSLDNQFVIDEIKDIDKPESSIIILDALDDNAEAANDIDGFLQKLEEATQKFKIVVITCRTQFFINKSSIPNNLYKPTSRISKKSHEYKIFFISPFTRDEYLLFLENKFEFIDRSLAEAINLYDNCQDLFSRPLLFQFIEDLLPLANKKKLKSVEYYSNIIESWLNREIAYQSNVTVSELWTLSKNIAFFIYENWQRRHRLSLSKEEFSDFLKFYHYDNCPYSFRDYSLLNRRNDGSIKFSHKSILEFFLAVYSIERPGVTLKSNGFDMAANFAKELCELYQSEIYLPNINYYISSFAVSYNKNVDCFFDDAINKLTAAKQKIDYLSANYNCLDIHAIVYSVWDLLFQVLYSIHKDRLILSYEESSNNTIVNIYKKIIFSLYLLRKYTIELQDCFKKDVDKNVIQKTILSIIKELDIAKNHVKEFDESRNSFYKDSIPYQYSKDTVIFPNYPNYNIDKYRISEYDILFIGFGFSDSNNGIEKNMVRLITNTISIRCFIKDFNNINEASSFFIELSKTINETKTTLILAEYILFRVSIRDDGTSFYYWSISKYDPDDIVERLTLLNSISIKMKESITVNS